MQLQQHTEPSGTYFRHAGVFNKNCASATQLHVSSEAVQLLEPVVLPLHGTSLWSIFEYYSAAYPDRSSMYEHTWCLAQGGSGPGFAKGMGSKVLMIPCRAHTPTARYATATSMVMAGSCTCLLSVV